jgi:endonuclease/exonuclease/phosphatase family metal-dependent hydrolase
MTRESEQAPAPDCHTGLEPAHDTRHHPELAHWRANVGSPVVLDAGPVASPELAGIDLLSWNLAIGRGHLPQLLAHLRASVHAELGVRPERPLVILAQEAFRDDASLPHPATPHYGTHVGEGERSSIVEAARAAGLSLRYSPSMRNGRAPSDRGNAILASVQLAHSRALLLPHVRQRRVAVSARLAGHPELTFVSAHLDTHGRPRGERAAVRLASGRLAQARGLAAYLHELTGSVVVGADLNSAFGVLDPAVRTLVRAGLHPAHRMGAWRHTYHAAVRLLLDHVLYRSPDRRIARVEVWRIDEVPGDRSANVFGSDHHPLLARIDLNGA